MAIILAAELIAAAGMVLDILYTVYLTQQNARLQKQAEAIAVDLVQNQIAGEVTSKYTVLNNVPRLLIETLCMGGVLAYLAVYIMAGGNLTEMIPQMTAFAFAATRLLPSVNRINGHVTNIAFFQPSLDYVYENVDFSDYTKYGEYQNKDDVNAAPIPVRDAICLNNITYLYPNTTKKILDAA